MIFTCQFKRLDFSSNLAKYTQERIERLDKFQNSELKVHVTFSKQGHQQCVDISLRLPSVSFRAHGESDDFYSSVDKAVAKIIGQFKKRRARLKTHRNYKVDPHQEEFVGDDFGSEAA